VQDIEKYYENETKKRIQAYLKAENDPQNTLLIPKKENVDLKRGLSSKVKDLDKLTQKAMLQLMSKVLC